jgi:N-methylhydantoinase B
VDSGGPGEFRGGLGYDKHIRMLKDGHFMSIADRSILACWGVNGGRAGSSFSVVIDPGGPNERAVEALADAEFVRAGELIRIRTTGGGGWGDPLERDPAAVLRDVCWGKVSERAARADYGVVLTGAGDDADGDDADGDDADGDDAAVDEPATRALRAELRAARPGDEPFFDRGPGYRLLSGGRASSEYDHLG